MTRTTNMSFPDDIEHIRARLDTTQIKTWPSILTLVVFVLTNINVLFPFTIPVPVPRIMLRALSIVMNSLRIAPLRAEAPGVGSFVQCKFPMNFVTTPLIADLFLLATTAIGRQEIHDGIIGANNIAPYDIMLFFISLAYIALSIDASGLIRYLAYRVLQLGSNTGHKLYLSLYTFFFAITTAIGNDPIILSGTPFLAYMTRVSANITQPWAWMFSQFAAANIASAILVSSNPTNLVIAGAFGIRFINYSANVIVPVIVTGILLFPFLLYVLFRDDNLVPKRIEMHQLSDEAREKTPVNPNIPKLKSDANNADDEKILPLEEIMNPYIDKVGATVASVILAVSLVTLLVVNAVTQNKKTIHVFWITAPAAALAFAFDLVWGWMNRKESRRIAHEGRDDTGLVTVDAQPQSENVSGTEVEKDHTQPIQSRSTDESLSQQNQKPRHLSSWISAKSTSFSVDFPTASTVLSRLPFALIPFAFCMFILVQALVTKGWVPVFAYGWEAWVAKTGTIGAIGGMGFVSVMLCNFAGTNIGTAILLARVVQAWQDIHVLRGTIITSRTFWGTIYSMILGVNYGAFSIAFSASLAGLLWRDILNQKFIHVRSRDFFLLNVPIIAFTMIVGCCVLLGQTYIVRDNSPYNQ